MKDVAEKAGVSVSTVSIVLSGNRRLAISEETRRNVLAIAGELNYFPNPHASNLAKGSSNLFGIVISEIANPFFPEVIRSFEKAATAHNFEMLLFNTEYDAERSERAVSKMISNNVCGVAVFTSKFARVLAKRLTENHIPLVVVQPAAHQPCVSTIEIDFSHGLQQAIDYLLALGHRHFCAIAGPDDIPSAKSYARTLARVAKQLRVTVSPVFSCNYRHDGGMTAVRSILEMAEVPTAILCANDLIALGAISELERVGLSVPEDISVIGFDDLVFAHLARPPLTTLAVARSEVGSLAFHTLIRMQETALAEEHVIRPRLVVRGSTAVPRRRLLTKTHQRTKRKPESLLS